MSRPMPNPPPHTERDHDWPAIAAGLRRSARALVGRAGEEAADDLVQQTLLRLLTRPGAKPSHRGYARAAMVRLWLDEQRSLRRRLARLARHAASLGRTGGSGGLVSDGDRVAALRGAIDLLPSRQRAVFVLHALEDMTCEQIGEALGASADAVRASLHLARVRLRRALGETL